uniref:Secreted protein n=1 Tax=Caenorhabditis tropicalis TaxID=1561998 RepID=A0A1I7V0E0_9PELO
MTYLSERVLIFLFTILLISTATSEVTESSDIKQSSAQAVAPTPFQVATSPHPFSRQIAAPSRIQRRSITPVPMIRAHRVYRH